MCVLWRGEILIMTQDNSTYEHTADDHHDITRIELIEDGRFIGKLEYIGTDHSQSDIDEVNHVMYDFFKLINEGYITISGPTE